MAKGRICLAYSGGLDTSTILHWLLDNDWEVVCFLANVGQVEDWDKVRAKAAKAGSKMVIKDVRREFVEKLCFRAIQCNAVYEGRYLLGTSLARPVIARAMMEVVRDEKVRFELAFLTIDPNVKIIAPWRIPEFFEKFAGRQALLDYAAEKGIEVTSTKAKPYSMDANLSHCSYEAGILEDPNQEPPADMWTLTKSPEDANPKAVNIEIEFTKGIPTKVKAPDGEYTDPLALFEKLNAVGYEQGIGRIDIVENRFIGLKSRGCYDAPAMSLMRAAHLDLEGLVLDAKVRSLRDAFVTTQWSQLLYDGFYFAPEREFVENSLVFSQKRVNGVVRMRLYRGNCTILGRYSDSEKLYDAVQASMDELTDFSPVSTTGFIEISAIRLKKYGLQKMEEGVDLSKPQE